MKKNEAEFSEGWWVRCAWVILDSAIYVGCGLLIWLTLKPWQDFFGKEWQFNLAFWSVWLLIVWEVTRRLLFRTEVNEIAYLINNPFRGVRLVRRPGWHPYVPVVESLFRLSLEWQVLPGEQVAAVRAAAV